MSVKQVSLEEFTKSITSLYTDVIGEKLGGKIHSFSDEWFAAAENLIKPNSPIRDATKFVYSGAWYDGWETRRHNTAEYDYVILKLGVSSAKLIGAEIDTAFFNGNHAPAISIDAINTIDDSNLNVTSNNWEEIFNKTECGPSSRHFFVLDKLTEKTYTHVKLKMYPDGGIARFRLYGEVEPNFEKLSIDSIVDYASVQNGGVVVDYSDQHFGTADNLLLPGRGHDMSDGWETKRSRIPNHIDWVIIKLGTKINIDEIIIDTAHFRGNFPAKVQIHTLSTDVKKPKFDDSKWIEILIPEKTFADKEHSFKKFVTNDGINNITHVKLTIIPDGGVKRVRVLGKRI
ncbi:hypothetical protein WICMUC_001226 [Wickerhamomyces mucosus]|uniref:allantoicase n=1 Tax=Wickerhamomyces mucosus TaxID=1378264 RepID=A0A9P8PVD9_9ASCO|nr:hypothetical protein WICMUC_001226 [Wickerhamomyces mucosus]